MPYLGNPVVDRFTSTKAASVYSGDGSTVAFTLEHSVGSDEDILVSVDGVIQEPSVAYAVSSGTTLTFTAAPSNNAGNNIFVYYLFRTIGTVTHPATSALSATSGTFSTTLGVTGASTLGAGLTVANGLTLTDGNLVVASGHGIDFSAVSHASGMTTELLDSYEEGVWTATINGASCSAAQTARYTKVGTSVIATFYINSITNTNDATQFRIGGLPFTTVNAALAGGITLGWANTANLTGFIGTLQSNSTYFYFSVQTGNADSRTHANIQSAGLTHLIATVTYRSV